MAPTRRSRPDAGGDFHETLTTTTAQSSHPQTTWRLAEDADTQLGEVGRWIDSLDVVVLDALGGGTYSPADALEFVLLGHGRMRRNLDAALAAVN